MKKVIYMHKFPNGMIYIGQANNYKNRWRDGKGYDQKVMKEAIEKYGWENIEHIILEDNVDEKDSDERENYYIGKYESYKNGVGYNTRYKNKVYPKHNYYEKHKIPIEKRKNKLIKIKLYEKDYNFFLEKATKLNMKVEKYIYIKLMEEITNVRILDML